ncbi:hypothetical protein BDZ90DRAFT_282232 [Jaminaea rosea]|uniref:Uncharacterized protein n=1 Tax=Jaminaea rosea TaxID=1569628 RepID=A0A316UN52_9BASI|nr:hypothetical protein BDZ90DRAFT_282232 [Jaminaea rosea]PWN24585.1 hypothetical protein BDZ90DRAFT_282232 [Jaminaea rosea]
MPAPAGKSVSFLANCTIIPIGFVRPDSITGKTTGTVKVHAASTSSRHLATAQWQWQSSKVCSAARDPQLRREVLGASPQKKRQRRWSCSDRDELVQASPGSAANEGFPENAFNNDRRSRPSAIRRPTPAIAQPVKRLSAPSSKPMTATTLPQSEGPRKVSAVVAAPRAAYRPLNLGQGDDHLEGPATAPSPTASANSSYIAAMPDTTPRFDKSQGLPVISAREHQRLKNGDSGRPLRLMRSAPDLLASASYSPASSSSPLPPQSCSSPTASTRPALPGKHRSWLSKKLTRHRDPDPDTDHEDHDPTSLSPRQAYLLLTTSPLNTACICVHCSGRIRAGLSPGYVPHWSKGARAKWLADRKQAEMMAAAQGPVETVALQKNALSVGPGKAAAAAAAAAHHQALSLNNGPQGIVLRNARSPPPPGMQKYDPPEQQSGRGKTAVAIKIDGPEPRREAPTTAEEKAGVDDEDDADAAADLRDIFSGSGPATPGGPSLGASAPPLQVDEVDQKRGEVHRPDDDIERPASPPTAAASPGIIDTLEARAEHCAPTPSDHVALADPSSHPLDSDPSLRSQVQRDLAQRMERRRSDQAIRRGGARGMLAQLEEADRREEVARERRGVARRRESSERAEEGEDVRPMGAWTPPLPGDRATSPSLRLSPSNSASAASGGLGLLRRSPSPSPLLERIKTAVKRPSLDGMHRSSSPGMLRSPSPLSAGAHAHGHAGGAGVPVVRTPSPFLARSPTIPEESFQPTTRVASGSGPALSSPLAVHPPTCSTTTSVPTAEEQAQADALPPQIRPSASRRIASSSSSSSSSAATAAMAAGMSAGGALGLSLSPTSSRSSVGEGAGGSAVAQQGKDKKAKQAVSSPTGNDVASSRQKQQQQADSFPWNGKTMNGPGSTSTAPTQSKDDLTKVASPSASSSTLTALRHSGSLSRSSATGAISSATVASGSGSASGSVRRSKTLPPSSAKAALSLLQSQDSNLTASAVRGGSSGGSNSRRGSQDVLQPSASITPTRSPAPVTSPAQEAQASAETDRRLRRRSFQRRISAPLAAAKGRFFGGLGTGSGDRGA